MSPRPPAIRIFAWLMLASGLLGLTSLLLLGPRLPAGTATPDLGITRPALAALWIGGYNLCFWFAIARRANLLAALLFSALTVVTLLGIAVDWKNDLALMHSYTMPASLAALATLAQSIAAALPFQRDAREWLRARGRLPDHRDIFG